MEGHYRGLNQGTAPTFARTEKIHENQKPEVAQISGSVGWEHKLPYQCRNHYVTMRWRPPRDRIPARFWSDDTLWQCETACTPLIHDLRIYLRYRFLGGSQEYWLLWQRRTAYRYTVSGGNSERHWTRCVDQWKRGSTEVEWPSTPSRRGPISKHAEMTRMWRWVPTARASSRSNLIEPSLSEQ